MTAEEWLEKVAADRPPLSAAQVALLRPVLAPATPAMRSGAPACQQERRPQPAKTAPERNTT